MFITNLLLQSTQPAGFYAIYDGHCGPLAAVYATSHLHMIMARHPFYLQNPQMALRHAFVATDEQFNGNHFIGVSMMIYIYSQFNKIQIFQNNFGHFKNIIFLEIKLNLIYF